MLSPTDIATLWLKGELARCYDEEAKCAKKIAEYDAAPYLDFSRLYVDTWHTLLQPRIKGLRSALRQPNFLHAPYMLYLHARDCCLHICELRAAALEDCTKPPRDYTQEDKT